MSESVFSEDFKIPETLVGLVIGRGGEQIKRLQMESGCKIRIAQESEGIERSCTLTGSQESIDEAKRMLGDVVRRGLSRENNQQGGGGGDPQQGGFNRGGGGFNNQRNFNNGGGGYGNRQFN